ncbi:ABC transporter substrate-binding protein [Cohnella hashimotonis]|uniref:ABC transporter substrate-binding protein n=1 Tax=Cohnella hashimotonis TaxID=2826895 RepID=A0ABT6TQC5_9BACL|nr:ABC transporter substrate-binding protein [Cohnella hashimotonis]MDI4648129.1 ABC transporter substrate-binding protein [Cohnella hashimotonis]
MRKRLQPISMIALILVTALMLLAAGCGSKNDEEGAASSSAAPASESASAPESASPSASASSSPQGSSAAAGATVYPLVIDNYTLSGEGEEQKAKQQTFDKAPERVVANTQPVAELLIKLGLGDKLVGVAALNGASDPEVSAEEFKKVPVLAQGYVSKEPVVGTNPDLVIGRAGLFADADWGNGSVDSLNGLGIHTYVNNASLQGATLDSLYRDIEEIGKIFDVQDKAAAHIAKLKARADALKTKYEGETAQKFAIVNDTGDGTLSVDSGSHDSFQHDALSLIKLNNAFHDVDGYEVSIEQLVAEKPDVLLLSYYTGAQDPESTLKAAYANPALQDIPAIKNKRIYVIDFNAFWGYGDQIMAAAEKLGQEVYGK